MSYRLLVVALLAACSDSTTGIEVIPGTIDVAEGEEAVAQLLFDGSTDGTFRADVDDVTAARLFVAIGEDGHSLHVIPRCSAVADGATRGIAEIRVSMTDRDTPPVIASVNIEANVHGNCAVKIEGWPGPCEDAPAQPPASIALAGPAQIMCIRVRVPDSLPAVTVAWPSANDVDPLFLIQEPSPIDPETMMPVATAPVPFVVDPDTTATRLVKLNRIDNFRGHKDFAMSWAAEATAPDTPENGVVHLDLVAGQPGDGAIRVRGMPNFVEEYGSAKFLFTTTYFDTPGTGTCVRATTQHDSTSLVVVEPLRTVAQGKLACGEGLHTVEFLTDIRSASGESIDLELLQCAGCGDDPTAACCESAGVLTSKDSATMTIPSYSVAENVSSGTIDARACVDIDQNGIPELVVGQGGSAQILVGEGTPDDIRFVAPEVSVPSPTSMFALEWRDGPDVRPVLVGEFSQPPFLRAATLAGWDTKQWAALPASPYGTDEWVPLAPKHGLGASYLVVQKSGSVFGFACISSECSSDGPLIDVSNVAGGSFPGQIRGIGVADIDGDKDLDVLVAVDSSIQIGGQRDLALYGYALEWSNHQLIGATAPTDVWMRTPTQISWSTLKFVSLEVPGSEDRVFVLARGGIQHALVEIAQCGSSCRGSQLVGTIGTPFDLANVSNALHVATDLGIWELVDQTWVQRDPERALGQSTFPVPGEETYGRTFRSCLMNPGARPSFLFDVEDGARWSFAKVTVETLPTN